MEGRVESMLAVSMCQETLLRPFATRWPGDYEGGPRKCVRAYMIKTQKLIFLEIAKFFHSQKVITQILYKADD